MQMFGHFCKHFRAVSILFHVWVPSAHPSICESVVLLLNSVSLCSMCLFVNLAHTLINVYVHKSVLVTGRKHVAAVCLRLFLGMGRVLIDWTPPPPSVHPTHFKFFSSFFFPIAFISFYQLFANTAKHCVWVPSAHPSTCDLVMLLLKFCQLNFHSMYLNVNPAYTLMCMYTNLPVTSRGHTVCSGIFWEVGRGVSVLTLPLFFSSPTRYI
jgi:hypothetical protein